MEILVKKEDLVKLEKLKGESWCAFGFPADHLTSVQIAILESKGWEKYDFPKKSFDIKMTDNTRCRVETKRNFDEFSEIEIDVEELIASTKEG